MQQVMQVEPSDVHQTLEYRVDAELADWLPIGVLTIFCGLFLFAIAQPGLPPPGETMRCERSEPRRTTALTLQHLGRASFEGRLRRPPQDDGEGLSVRNLRQAPHLRFVSTTCVAFAVGTCSVRS